RGMPPSRSASTCPLSALNNLGDSAECGHYALKRFDLNGVRIDSSVTGSTEEESDTRLMSLLQAGAYFVSPSSWLAGRIKKATGISCRLIPNGVEENPHNFKVARERLGLSVNARMVLFAAHGGLRAGLKGAGRWTRIWEQIKKAVPSAVCFMVGGESMRRGNDLLEWPYVDREKMALLMAAADLLVYPSLADNHPLVVLEAMSGGTAVSAYSVGGIPEQIRHAENGLLAPLHDEATLIANSIRMLNSSLLLHKMGWSGKELWRRHFQADCMARRYAGLYDELCFGQRG
ncbi:MAG: glycosyltransferase, partial [Desulfovibrionaceae bacterium]|nr:glycosyltransferase [Desulfovibrionaceae bacterium]